MNFICEKQKIVQLKDTQVLSSISTSKEIRVLNYVVLVIYL